MRGSWFYVSASGRFPALGWRKPARRRAEDKEFARAEEKEFKSSKDDLNPKVKS